jgi:hypothetical protein
MGPTSHPANVCLILQFSPNSYQPIKTPWSQSASELYRPRDRRLSAKLVPTFEDRGCRVVSATDPHDRILGFLDRSRYYFFQIAPHVYSRGWVDPVPDPLLLRKCGSARNLIRDPWISLVGYASASCVRSGDLGGQVHHIYIRRFYTSCPYFWQRVVQV